MALPKRSETKPKLQADKDTSESESSESEVSESLSDIDDAEVAPYLNTKKEAFYKSIIWEAMNKDYAKGKSRKRARQPKKAAPPNKAVKISTEMDNKKRPSSKINYDALKKLSDEDDDNYAPGFEEGSHGDTQNAHERLDSEPHGSGGNYDDELEFDDENAYGEEAEARPGYDNDDTYYEDYNGYGCDEENGFDEF